MILHMFYTPGLAIYSYLIADCESKRALVIDPTRDVEPYIRFATQEGLEITDIAETHVHADFVSGAVELKARLQDKPQIHCSALGGEEWLPAYADVRVEKGGEIHLGHTRLLALHTPGHTPEHIVWLCYDEDRSEQAPCLAFTGDLLFVGSVGRPDLLGKEQMQHLAPQLYQSLFQGCAELPDYLEIFPAHGAGSLCGKALSDRPSSTLGYERLYNAFLYKCPLNQWIESIQKDIPAAPAHFTTIKKNNTRRPRLLSESASLKAGKVPELFIDLRSPSVYWESHLAGSLNIPLEKSFCNWVGSVLDADIPIGLVAECQSQLDDAEKQLCLIGFDQVVSKLIWNEKELMRQYAIATQPTVDVKSLFDKIQQPGSSVFVLDVRTPVEWTSAHIAGAHHMELARLVHEIDSLPSEQTLYTICGSGLRSSVAVSLLRRRGYTHAVSVHGGMAAWKEAKLPLTIS
jgi:hydroxyacylglutathione hydrolase